MAPPKKQSNSSSNRLISLFKRFISKKQDIEIVKNLYQRDFDRFPVEFKVAIALMDKNGDEHEDRAELHNVSGSGAMFITRIPEKYYLDQTLHLKIFLAGTEDVRACIKTESTVVRMQPIHNRDENDRTPLMGIAVKFKKTFEFERVDANIFGENQ